MMALFDLKYLMYYKFVYEYRVPEATFLSAISPHPSQNLEYRRMERTFLYRIGKFDDAYNATISLLDSLKSTSIDDEVTVEEMKELTYCLLSRKEFEKARLHEQKRLKILRQFYQADDFMIVESFLLIAIASAEA